MKYRKKPELVDAIQYTGNNKKEIIDFADDNIIIELESNNVLLNAFEGWMTAHPGNWIVKDAFGEFYPVQNDIFIEIYEVVK